MRPYCTTTPVQFMDPLVPREEVDYVTLYKTFLNCDTPLPLLCYDSRSGEVPRCRLPFPPERSGYSWITRLDRARECLPRAVFRPTRPKIYKRTLDSRANQNVTVLALEVPQKRGRGRPKKESTVLVDAAALNRNSFFVKRAYRNESDEPGTSSGVHTLENYTLHGHGGADVNVSEIGILRPERYYLRDNSRKPNNFCEYDLDDQDIEWLRLIRGTSDEMGLLNEDLLERIIEELEMGWDVLTRPLRKLQQRKEAALFPEEVPCEICGDSDTSNCNVIVLCDDCDLAVHQECYGVPHIPEGPWLCRPCSERRIGSSMRASCMLCPWPGGALRKTSDHRWVHSLCAHMVPETSITFSPSDPYDLVDTCTLHQDRGKLRCVLCRSDAGSGFPIQCSSKLCHVAIHPMCARAARWSVLYSAQKAFCPKHAVEGDVQNVNESESSVGDPKIRSGVGMHSPTKLKFPFISIGDNCPLHVQRGGEKLRLSTFAPNLLIDHISADESVFEASGVPLSMRSGIVRKISKYWALKRESRRGTPLLKSLQLEPSWSQSDALSEEAFTREWTDKMGLMRSLQTLRERLRLVRDREVAKLASFSSSKEIFDILSSPFSRILEKFVHKLQDEVDFNGYFAYPVPCDLFPDYPMIVACPMDFSTILRNLELDASSEAGSDPSYWYYPSLLHFYADLKLIWENSRLYNTRTSVFYQAADRLEFAAKVLLSEIWGRLDGYRVAGPFDILNFTSGNDDPRGTVDFDSLNLPEPTPVRFPKTSITPIAGVPSIKDRSTNLGPAAQLKRRGRPPKRRDEAGCSIESLDEEGNTTTTMTTTTGDINATKHTSASVRVRGRKRGRPRKIINEN